MLEQFRAERHVRLAVEHAQTALDLAAEGAAFLGIGYASPEDMASATGEARRCFDKAERLTSSSERHTAAAEALFDRLTRRR
jgi:hypothetical protein